MGQQKRRSLKEMFVGTGLRNSFSALTRTFYGVPSQPLMRDSIVDYNAARECYYNNATNVNQGTIFARPIVDVAADFISTPTATVKEDKEIDPLMNNLLSQQWAKALIDMYRISMRDTRVWVRLRRPVPGVLQAPNENEQLDLEIITLERVQATYNAITRQLDRVVISNRVWVEDNPYNPAQANNGVASFGRFHDILEIITPNEYSYWDKTSNEPFEGTVTNEWGFIPLLEVFNEYDPTLNGGICEFEAAYVFFKAFHDIMNQIRQGFKNHATPKIKFKVGEVATFLENNFPDAMHEGKLVGNINWEGREILFMESDEDAGFLEVKSAIGDATVLLDFVISCISIATRTPKWALMRVVGQEVASTATSENLPFENRINSKRINYGTYIQTLLKMALKILKDAPMLAELTWSPLQTADVVQQAQALNQTVMAAEVANRAGAISLDTYRSKIRKFFPTMKDNQSENAATQAEQTLQAQQAIDHAAALQAVSGAPSSGKSGQNGRTRLPVIPTGENANQV